MKKYYASVMAAAICVLPVMPSFAIEQSAYVGLTSNYVFRGQTLSDDNMAVQGGYDIKQSEDKGWYAGTFLSMFDTGTEDGIRTDFHGGWKGSLGGQNKFGYDVGINIYEYQGASNFEGQKEIFGGITYETAYIKLFFGDDDNFSNGDYVYLDLGGTFTIMKDIDLALHFGRTSRDFAKDYNDISASVGKEVNGFDLNLGLTYEDERDDFEFFVKVAKSFDL